MSNVDQAKKQILVCTRLVSFLAYAPDDQSQMQLVAVVVVAVVLATVVVVDVARNFYSVGKFFCQRFDLISQANTHEGKSNGETDQREEESSASSSTSGK